MASSIPEEGNIIKDPRNLFTFKKEANDTANTDKISFRIKKNQVIKGRILTDIRIMFQHEEENYLFISYSNADYKERETKSDTNKRLSVKEYLKSIMTYLKEITCNLKKSNT